MATITDFDVFLDNVEDLEDAFCLDQTIRTKSSYGCYHFSENDEKIFISSDIIDDTLMLVNDKSKNYFLDLLEQKWSSEGMPLDIYYEMMRQMGKDD